MRLRMSYILQVLTKSMVSALAVIAAVLSCFGDIITEHVSKNEFYMMLVLFVALDVMFNGFIEILITTISRPDAILYVYPNDEGWGCSMEFGLMPDDAIYKKHLDVKVVRGEPEDA